MTLDILYFIPEWDDLVDSQFDFWNDVSRSGSKKVYSHEIYNKPNYDGILISKMKIDQSKKKVEAIMDKGIKQYLRFDGPIFGDCGAWGYANQTIPPYTTNEILEYYDQVGVTYGVSIDHLAITKDKEKDRRRIELTKRNAELFIHKYQKKEYSFLPVGAIQGWDLQSYRESLIDIIDLGYTNIAIGGMARTPTINILKILKGLQKQIQGKNLWLHLFGVSRLGFIRKFHKYGIRSFDSASVLRKAWLGGKENYLNKYYNGYTALRIPFTTRGANKKYRPFMEAGLYSDEDMKFQEMVLYSHLRKYEFEQNISVKEIVNSFYQFHNQFEIDPKDYTKDYTRTLTDRPWEICECKICNEVGMDVIIFRGNNRNRRRGFHNTYVFYKLLNQIRNNPDFDLKDYQESDPKRSKELIRENIKRIKPLNNSKIINKVLEFESVKFSDSTEKYSQKDLDDFF